MRGYEFTVVIERDEDGRFVPFVLPSRICYTEGETEEEARRLIEDAIRLHVESRIARDEPISQEGGLPQGAGGGVTAKLPSFNSRHVISILNRQALPSTGSREAV